MTESEEVPERSQLSVDEQKKQKYTGNGLLIFLCLREEERKTVIPHHRNVSNESREKEDSGSNRGGGGACSCVRLGGRGRGGEVGGAGGAERRAWRFAPHPWPVLGLMRHGYGTINEVPHSADRTWQD